MGARRGGVGGARLVTTITRGASLSGGSTSTTMSTILNTVASTLGTNSGVRLINFNAFRIHGHTTGRNHGPEANRAVAIPTSGIPTFGTNGTLGSTITRWLELGGGFARHGGQ